MSESEGTQEPGEPVSIHWTGANDAVAVFANAFHVSVEPQVWTLSIGQLTPPLLVGTAADQQRQLSESGVQVRTIVRLALTPDSAAELGLLLESWARTVGVSLDAAASRLSGVKDGEDISFGS